MIDKNYNYDDDLNNTITISRVQYHKKKYKPKSRLRPWAFCILFIVFLIIIVFSSYILFNWLKDNKDIDNLNSEIDKDVTAELINEEGTLINPPEDKESDYWYYINVPFYNVDFKNLLTKNKDTVAFIHMENTNINYPVVQTKDNEYYLKHAFDNTKNDAGWVFMDYRNNKNLIDDNTIIYGHGRLNKTVFGSLKNVLTQKWQNNKDNYTISISTQNKNAIYQIFSLYTIQSESYYITPTFKTIDKKEKWLSTMKERNIAPIDTAVNIKDKILTLSTCENNNGGRIVVHAKLIKEQKR